jgi:hypothetical protein
LEATVEQVDIQTPQVFRVRLADYLLAAAAAAFRQQVVILEARLRREQDAEQRTPVQATHKPTAAAAAGQYSPAAQEYFRATAVLVSPLFGIGHKGKKWRTSQRLKTA